MNKTIIILIVIGVAIGVVSCKEKVPKPITKEYLVSKKFTKPALMGSKVLEFVDNEKVNFVICDKRSYGYNGTYILENKEGKQYIKISNIEKFGAEYMLNSISEKEKIFEVKSPRELKETHTGAILELLETQQGEEH